MPTALRRMIGLKFGLLLSLLTICSLIIVVADAGRPSTSSQTAFETAMRVAMERMHADMTVKPTGDPDRDFAAMMIPHHQGAIDMAKAQLLYGRDPALRRLAQGIIVEQSQEIEVMSRALADGICSPLPTRSAHQHRKSHP